MAITLKIKNFDPVNTGETSQLAASIAAGVTSVELRSAQGLADGDFILIGATGSEASEIVQISGAPGNTTITLAVATKYPHAVNDQITKLNGDHIKVYKAANVDGTIPPDSAFTVVIGNVAIDPDQLETSVTDQSGSSAYWYKYTYLNSITSHETSLASSTAARLSAVKYYASIDAVRQESGFGRASYITDALIIAKLQAAQSEIDSKLGGFYTVPFAEPINPFISDICKRLAAGLLLLEQYGSFTTANTANGDQKVKSARDDIASLQNGSAILRDAAGASIATPNAGGFYGWPNDTTAETDRLDGGGDFMFRVSDRY